MRAGSAYQCECKDAGDDPSHSRRPQECKRADLSGPVLACSDRQPYAAHATSRRNVSHALALRKQYSRLASEAAPEPSKSQSSSAEASSSSSICARSRTKGANARRLSIGREPSVVLAMDPQEPPELPAASGDRREVEKRLANPLRVDLDLERTAISAHHGIIPTRSFRYSNRAIARHGAVSWRDAPAKLTQSARAHGWDPSEALCFAFSLVLPKRGSG